MRAIAVLLLLAAACACTVCTDAARGKHHRSRRPHGRRLRDTLPLLPKAFVADPETRSPGQVFYNIYSLTLGDGRNFTFAQPGYVASTGFTVNATLDSSVNPGQLQLYCASGAAQAQNRSAALPSVTSALGTTSYTNMSAVLKVSTNHSNPFSSGSMFRRTGLEGDSVSYTDEGIAYSDPITCVVRYGNSTDVPSSNTSTYLGVRLTLTLHYPQPTLVPSEQTAIQTIFNQCCNSTDSCRAWKRATRDSNSTNRASANFCSVPGQICHPNGTLAVLDTQALRLTCHFPYRQLAAFHDLASLSLDFCWPNSQAARCFRSFGENTGENSTQSTPRSSPASWVDLFATLGTLRNLESLSITADNAFNGMLLPDMLTPGQATICSLARAKLGYLKISDVDGQADYVMHSLNGTLPACLFDSRSQIRTISVASTNLTGFEKPWLPSKKLAKLSYIGNINTYGDIPEFLGGLTNLSVLHLEDNSFNGSVPASLGNLTALKELSVEYQALVGPLPDNLAASPKLRTLGLGFNNFAGSVPSSIGASTSLKDVTLMAANLSGSLPRFSASSQLRTILASDNNLTGPFPTSLGQLQYLQELHLDNNALTGTMPPASPGALRQLRIIDLSNNNISGLLRASWAGLPSLTLLDVSFNNFNGTVPGSMFRAPLLETALLQDNSLTGILPATQAGNQTNLAHLKLSGNLLSGSIPSSLCTLSALETLNMSANYLTGSLPACMGDLGNLTSLDISNNGLSGSISPDWAASLSAISFFHAGSNNFSGQLPTGFNGSVLGSGLRILDLSNNSFSGSLPPSYKDLRSLRDLLLSDNYLSGTIPVEWNKLANPLVTLDLSDNNLTGIIPANVSYQIPILKFQNNYFQDVPRSWYGKRDRAAFWFLTDLSIQGNNLTGPFPDGLARPSSTFRRTMTYLDISDNNLSGPLPNATNATAPFFRDCWYFNASLNNLSGPIPEDFSRSLIFNASAGFNWAASFLGRAEALAVARQFTFDVSNNSLSGDLPSFLAPAKLPKYLNASSVQLKGNHFSCSSAQDKGYLNLTSCAQAAGSAQASGSGAGTDSGRAGLGKGAIAGIVVGALCALALFGGVLAYALRRRRSMQGWQKETLDGHPVLPKQGPGVELTNSSALA